MLDLSTHEIREVVLELAYEERQKQKRIEGERKLTEDAEWIELHDVAEAVSTAPSTANCLGKEEKEVEQRRNEIEEDKEAAHIFKDTMQHSKSEMS